MCLPGDIDPFRGKHVTGPGKCHDHYPHQQKGKCTARGNNDVFGGTVIQAPEIDARNGLASLSPFKPGEGVESPKSFLRQMFGGGSGEPGFTTVLMAAFNISQDRMARSRMAGDPPDIAISPQSHDIGLFDFDKAAEAIAAGREAAEKALPEIKRVLGILEIASQDPPPDNGGI
mgnify:CR=1 FL=1